MKLWEYIVRRLLLLIPVLLGVSVITFALTRSVGDPAAIYIDERCSINPACVEAIHHRYGFDLPIPLQYVHYMQALFAGDLGYSRTAKLQVSDAIVAFFPATFELATASMLIAVVLAIPLGVISATKRDRPIDHATRIFALSGVSVPVFWLALMLKWTLYLRAFELFGTPIFPPQGRAESSLYGVPGAPVPAAPHLYTLDAILAPHLPGLGGARRHLALPPLPLALGPIGTIPRA